eukprot:7449883-Pyramimonas_sp.AAC.1
MSRRAVWHDNGKKITRDCDGVLCAVRLSNRTSFLLLLHVFLHETAPPRAQCEIAAPALYEEALRVPGGSQGCHWGSWGFCVRFEPHRAEGASHSCI